MKNSEVWTRLAPFRLLGGIGVFTVGILTWLWPFLPEQDRPAYYNFSDHSNLFGIPHSLDVLSNAGFLVAGLLGLYWLIKNRPFIDFSQTFLMGVFALSAVFIGIGSAYFHLDPNPKTMFWDRLPMAICFSSLISLVLGDRISPKIGLCTGIIFIPLAALSVVWWSQGLVTLRPYIVLQYGGMGLLLLIAWLRPRGTIPNRTIVTALGLYALSKVFEMLDQPVMTLTGVISGHSLKHIFAGLALLKLVAFMREKSK